MKPILEQITIDDVKAGNLIPVDVSAPTVPSSDTLTPSNSQSGFEPVQMGLGGVTPADQTPAPSDLTPATDSEETPNEDVGGAPTERELELFKKFHASNFDPNSPLDKQKLEQIRQAAEEVGQEDDTKIQAAAYKKQYSEGQPNSSKTSKSQPVATEAEKRQRLLKPVNGMFVRTGFNQFRPAVQADMEAKTPLFMQNPNPVLRQVNPYVQVDRTAMKAKKASPVDQQAVDREMAAKGFQRLGPNGVRTEKGGRKERKSSLPGAAGSLSNFFGDVGNTLTGR